MNKICEPHDTEKVVRPKTFLATDHDIDHNQIDPDAIYIVAKLKQAGYTAYLVGGSVRDLLVKRRPKDYDISTSAKPEEIKSLFGRKCLLIGRRFRLAHIRFGHKIIEVSTFRSGDNDSDLIIRDNTWGTEEEDVIRRDFTINGLFYDPSAHSVIDYVGGWDDIHSTTLRSIGDPMIRFKQDPVRMIRLVKFRARFGFSIDQETKEALLACRDEIVKSAPARVLEEIFRMLESGVATSFFHLMTQAKLLHHIFPSLTEYLESEKGQQAYQLLEIADQMNQNTRQRPLDRSVLSACLFYPILEDTIKKEFLDNDLLPNLGDIISTTSTLIRDFVMTSFSHFPRRISTTMASIIAMQYRMTPLGKKRHTKHKALKGKDFPLALALLKIRALANSDLMDDYNKWQSLYHQAQKEGTHRPPHHPPPASRRRRRRPHDRSNEQ